MLTGKIALVTGASRGIGKCTALTLASYGATVIVNYNGSKEKAEEVVAELTENGGKAVTYCCNVSDYDAVATMMKDIVSEGNTYWYLMLEGSDALFEGKAKEHLEIMKKQVGSNATVEYVPQSEGVNSIISVK